MADPQFKAGASDLGQPLTKCHPATLPQPQPSPGVLAPQGILSHEGPGAAEVTVRVGPWVWRQQEECPKPFISLGWWQPHKGP